jgi:hypothetical protein
MDTATNISRVLQLFFLILFLILYIFVYIWIVKLEQTGCECSKDWRRGFIKVFAIVIIVMILLKMFVNVHDAIMTVYFIASLVFIISVFQYIHELKRIKCECSEAKTRDILEIVNYIQLGLLALVAVVFIIVGIRMMTNRNASPGKIKSASKRK